MNNNEIKNAALIAAEKEIVMRMRSSIIARVTAEAKEKGLSGDEEITYIMSHIHDEMHARSDIPSPEQSIQSDYLTDIDTLAKSDFLRTGIRTLDNCIAGMAPGDLVSICALPAHGKSALGMQIAKKVAQQGHKILLFSFEMNRKQLMDRYILSDNTHIDARKLKVGKLTYDEQNSLKKSLANISPWLANITIYAADTIGIMKVRQIDTIKKIVEQVQPRLVIIDQLNKIEDAKTVWQSDWFKLQEITKECKKIATDYNCTVILESQINSKSQSINESHGPAEGQIKGTGAVLEESDIVIVPYVYPNQGGMEKKKIKIKILKNRQGPQGYFDCNFYASRYTIYDIDDYEIP